MRRQTTCYGLAMLNALPVMLSPDILIQLAAKSSCQDLYSPANAQYGNLTVNGQTYQKQLLCITAWINGYAIKSFLTQIVRVYVGPARQNYSVKRVKQRDQRLLVIIRRNDHGGSSGLQYRHIIALSQSTVALPEITAYTYNRSVKAQYIGS